ncbi:MAG: peptide ABC transporter substrate-binding protein [Oceanospirillaceae bacterium]|nr:peptide ABC transporter substrate-binding protein [Oceanospirillaceae bacterium]|tara:strand:+ start:1729 stop:3378 length:1650 start_codon:yes stop_codon:yes gene_type:complete
MTPTYFKRISLLLIPFLTLGLMACSKGDSKSQVELGNEQSILHLGNGTEISDVDPHITTGMPEYHIQMALFEGLVAKDPKTLEIIPAVAESWTVSEDGTTYTFKIRDNAKWSDGDALTAQDFVYSYHRAMMPALGNQYAYSLYILENAEAFHKGEISDFSQVGIHAIDDKTLEFKLIAPVPYFLKLLDHHSMFPVQQKTVEKFGAMDERGTKWTRAENFVGNGAYTIKEWTPNKIFIAEKNPNYWDADNVSIQQIYFYPVELATTEERMFRAGQLHMTNDVPLEKFAEYKTDAPDMLYTAPYYGTYFYRFNTENEALKDVRVRKALAMALDRKAITERVTKSGEVPAYALTPPDDYGYKALAAIEYNPEKARELLAEAGYPGGEGIPALELMYNTLESHKKIALAVQQMWKTELGVDVTLQNQEWKVYLDRERTGNFQISRAAWIGDYLDPSTFLEMFVTDGGNNKTNWGNARYDELINMAANTGDLDKRFEYFQEADQILVDEVPIIPVYYYASKHLVHPSLKGINTNVMDYKPYKYMTLVPESGAAE